MFPKKQFFGKSMAQISSETLNYAVHRQFLEQIRAKIPEKFIFWGTIFRKNIFSENFSEKEKHYETEKNQRPLYKKEAQKV